MVAGESLSTAVLRPVDYRAVARSRLAPDVWDYVEGGSGSELTPRANAEAFNAVRIVPRVLVDVSACDPRARLLGADLAVPLGVAPMAYQTLLHPDGEIAAARGAGAAGALYIAGMFAGRGIDEIAAAAGGPLWLQVYWLRDRRVLADLVARSAWLGYRAIVLTVDAPRFGQRLRDVRNGFAVPPDVAAVNLPRHLTDTARRGAGTGSALAANARELVDPTVTWADLAWLRERSPLPVVLKGVLSADDARLAVEHGADGVVVSNHGGRQVDGAVTGLEALPGVVEAVNGSAAVLVDGGVRRGRDVFVARALGADAVLVGRAAAWALAADGADGVSRQLGMLTEELTTTMALAGRPRLADIDRDAVVGAGRRGVR